MTEATIPALILAVVAALIAGIPPTLAAMAAYRAAGAALKTAQHATELTQTVVTKADEQAVKTEGLIGRVDQVHTLTNSNLSAVKAELQQATQQIASLTALIHELRDERSKAQLREALATMPPGATPSAPVVVLASPSEKSLTAIDDNTKEIAENTKT